MEKAAVLIEEFYSILEAGEDLEGYTDHLNNLLLHIIMLFNREESCNDAE